MISKSEATMEMVLPLIITDVMQALEDLGVHPPEDFTERVRAALLKIVPSYPNLEQDIWTPKKEEIIQHLCKIIEV